VDSQTRRQHGDSVSLPLFLQNKESRINNIWFQSGKSETWKSEREISKDLPEIG
jgi:hypothetical protein